MYGPGDMGKVDRMNDASPMRQQRSATVTIGSPGHARSCKGRWAESMGWSQSRVDGSRSAPATWRGVDGRGSESASRRLSHRAGHSPRLARWCTPQTCGDLNRRLSLRESMPSQYAIREVSLTSALVDARLVNRLEGFTERRRRRLSPFAPRKHAVKIRDWPLGSKDPPSIGDVFLSPFAPRKIPVSIGDPPIGSQDLPSIGDVFLSPFAPRRTALFMIDTRL